MATIGTVTKHDDGHYEGEFRTLSIRADIAIVPVYALPPGSALASGRVAIVLVPCGSDGAYDLGAGSVGRPTHPPPGCSRVF